MSDEPQLLYLEPDDEITTVVRRLRESDASRVVLVASGRTKATTSAVALRLLAQVAGDEGREIALVADPAARALAAEAGIPAYASVADVSAEGSAVEEPAPSPRRAPIHVVRGEAQPVAPEPVAPRPAAAAAVAAAVPGPRSFDETQAVSLPPVPRPPLAPRTAGRRRLPRAAFGAAVAGILVAGALLAAVAPAATVRIQPASIPIGPLDYDLELPLAGTEAGSLTAGGDGTAGGERLERTAATGSVTLFNWNTVPVQVSAGTELSVDGGVRFTTTETVTVPSGRFTSDGRVQAGEAATGVTAAEPGPAGNVVAEAINRVESRLVMSFLRGFPNNSARLVSNGAATSGGTEETLPVIEQADVDMVVAAITADLERQLAERLAADAGRLYPAVTDPETPVIEIPADLVGAERQETFELTGTLDYSRPYVLSSEVEAAARERLVDDPATVSPGYSLLPESIEVALGTASSAGDRVLVSAAVSAAALADVDADAIRELIGGLTAAQARDALADIGAAQVDLWPDWVDRVPELGWRVSIDVAAQPEQSSLPSGSGP